jgi:hypothetical protein
MKGFQNSGKQVLTADGEHFADATSALAAVLIVAALNFRKHHPVIDGDVVLCSRCRSELPHEGGEPCVPRAPRCKQTLDMFGDEGGDDATTKQPVTTEEVQPVRASSKRRTQRHTVLP